MLRGPWLDVIVPRDHPGVLPQVQAELPVPRARQHLVLHSHLHLERGAIVLGGDVDGPLVDAGFRAGRDVQREPDWPDGSSGQVEPLERLEAVRHEVGLVRIGRPAADFAGTVRVVGQHVANQIDLKIALAEDAARGGDEIVRGQPNLAQRVRGPEQEQGIEPLTAPAGGVPQLCFLWQVRDVGPNVRLIGRRERHMQAGRL